MDDGIDSGAESLFDDRSDQGIEKLFGDFGCFFCSYVFKNGGRWPPADSTDQPQVDEAWEQEIQHRIAAVDSGIVKGIAYNDVMREADQRPAP